MSSFCLWGEGHSVGQASCREGAEESMVARRSGGWWRRGLSLKHRESAGKDFQDWRARRTWPSWRAGRWPGPVPEPGVARMAVAAAEIRAEGKRFVPLLPQLQLGRCHMVGALEGRVSVGQAGEAAGGTGGLRAVPVPGSVLRREAGTGQQQRERKV